LKDLHDAAGEAAVGDLKAEEIRDEEKIEKEEQR